MMKKLLVTSVFVTMFFMSCIDNPLDRQPLNLITDADVWESEQLVVTYMVALYDALPIGFDRNAHIYQAHMTDEASHPYSHVTITNDYGNQFLAHNTGMYTWIRRVNYFLSQIEKSMLDEDTIKELSAEARFIRAFYYFDLVKKYGGMPIINEVQTFEEDNIGDLQVERNTEDEVYEFILSELDLAIQDLPIARDANNENRATKAVALALKSRAMLYAGSIATYGSIQLNGLVGIPSDKAEFYFQESLDASVNITESGQFSLYEQLYDPDTGSGDPVANYQNIFIDENNDEIIFQKAYSSPDKMHNYDGYNMPESFKPGCCGNASAPTLEMVESYEFIDGSPGQLNYEGIEFSSPEELFQGKDPRFEASIIRTGDTFAGRAVEIYRGVYDEDGTLYNNINSPFPSDPSVRQVGIDGPYTLGDVGKTGFYIKKYMNTNQVPPEGRSEQNYIEIRYGEILLNLAEAAYELGETEIALNAVNKIRARAGINLLDLGELTLNRLRNERKVELAFEDKRFWDIRRWRIGTELFRNTNVYGLWPYLKYENGEYKYIFQAVSGSPIDNGEVRIFNERDYYSNLSGYIGSNPNIINNPGW